MAAPDFIDARLLSILACPRDHSPLHIDGRHLYCGQDHRYPIVDGIPVFLLAEAPPTIAIASASLKAAETNTGAPLYLETLGLSDDERRDIEHSWKADDKIDTVISHLIGATSGFGYVHLIGRLDAYPIPDIPLAPGDGERLIDIGCNWGRWSIAAARQGWNVVGIDPSLGALLAAKRAFGRDHPDIQFVCADARHLPFKADAFAAAFSYSVLQHFAEADAEEAIAEIDRVLKADGIAKIQMAHAGGLRARHVMRRDSDDVFRVRYWSLDALRDVFARHIGPVELMPEAFGGLGLLTSDFGIVSAKAKLLIVLSATLKWLTRIMPGLIRVADSVTVSAVKR